MYKLGNIEINDNERIMNSYYNQRWKVATATPTQIIKKDPYRIQVAPVMHLFTY